MEFEKNLVVVFTVIAIGSFVNNEKLINYKIV